MEIYFKKRVSIQQCRCYRNILGQEELVIPRKCQVHEELKAHTVRRCLGPKDEESKAKNKQQQQNTHTKQKAKAMNEK